MALADRYTYFPLVGIFGAVAFGARDLAMRLTRTLGTRVEVLEVGKERGQIAIHYHSLDQLDALLERLMHS